MSGEFDLTTELNNPRTSPEQRGGAALAAARWCRDNGHGAGVLRDLLDALLEDPFEARRAA